MNKVELPIYCNFMYTVLNKVSFTDFSKRTEKRPDWTLGLRHNLKLFVVDFLKNQDKIRI